MKGEPSCPRCGGIGYYVLDLPVDHPDFNKLITCECKQEQIAQRRHARLMRLSNLGGLSRMRFDTFLPEGIGLPEPLRRNMRVAYETAREFAREPRGWLVFLGGYGCGKTHLAASIANEVIARDEPVLFVIVPDLLDQLRSTYAPQSQVTFDDQFDSIREIPLLILDDLGTQSATPWAQEKLYQLINHRYNAQLPTVFTTNCRLEDLEPRIRSRMTEADLSRIVPIRAPDYRSSGQPGQDTLDNGLNTLVHLSHMTFENFSLRRQELDRESQESLEKALQIAINYAESPENWLIIQGQHGSGKTHLAAAIANTRQNFGEQVIFVTAPDLLDYLRAAYSPSSQISFDRRFEEIRRCQLLVLDDLGTESATPWAKEKLYQIINYRFNSRLPTVFTTVKTLEEIDPHIRSRIMQRQRATVCELLAPSYGVFESTPSARGRRRKSVHPGR